MRRAVRGLLAASAAAATLLLAGANAPGVANVAVPGQRTDVAPRSQTDAMWVRYPQHAAALGAQAELGKLIFFDRSLSASGQLACSTCHDPDHAYGPPNGLAVQLGGADMHQPGLRAVPSLRYLRFTPKFTQHLAQPSSDGAEDEGPAGGFARDGAAQSLHEQALLPLLNAAEMGNRDLADLGARLRKAAYVDRLRRFIGAGNTETPDALVAAATAALEAFQMEDPSFEPYTSKFDAVMSGHAAFTDQERRGYRLFNDPHKGNCAKCHVDAPGAGGRPAQFTDFGLVALGVPRNAAIPANGDRRHFDLGACGPVRKDLAHHTELCGLFKTPTLRNVAGRTAFFHNGRFHTLAEALEFYSERDTDPTKWHAPGSGAVAGFDDLPARYWRNVDRVDEPFTRKRGQPPVFAKAEIDDLVAFLETLDDGFSRQPGGPAATPARSGRPP